MFIDTNSRVDRQGLQLYVLNQLNMLHEKAVHCSADQMAYWQQLEVCIKQQLTGKDQTKALNVVNQLKGLPLYIKGWIQLAVDTPERFDFFVLTKAHELQSGNQENDYFWALQIRHDQLIALVRVLELLLDKMNIWLTLRPEHVFEDPVFSGLTEYGVEDQVYLEAETVYKERMRLVQGK